MIEATVIADSVSPAGKRITTLSLKYPRFIHAEFMTHRVFSRNASSSRAIPVEKMIKEIETNWARPIDFRKNQKGMQGGDVLTGDDEFEALTNWECAKEDALHHAQRFIELGVHKQYANRLLEPFSHISVVVTATEWNNFFALRRHEMAQPEIHLLADKMHEAMENSAPRLLGEGHYHVPYVSRDEYALGGVHYFDERAVPTSVISSVARCARVSYKNHDGTEPDFEKDLALYKRLVGSHPIHASPAEHQAMSTADPYLRSGNFVGWVQYRKTLVGENID